MGRGSGWSSIEPTQVVALPSAVGGGASTGGEGLQWWVFPLGITQEWRSALCWFSLPPQAFLFIELLPYPIPSGFLLTAHSSPLPGSALQTPHFSTQPLSTAADTLSGWVGRTGVSTLCTGLTLSCCHRLLPCSLPTENEAPLLSQLSSHQPQQIRIEQNKTFILYL